MIWCCKFAGVGDINYCRCCSIRARNINSTFSVGNRTRLERNSFWWLQEPITSALACKQVLKQGKLIKLFHSIPFHSIQLNFKVMYCVVS